MRMTLLALGLVSPALATPALATTQDEVLQARLLSGWQTDAGTFMAAIELDLAPGWKTYWRSPGEAGIPPSFNWSASRNLGSVVLHWPRPEVFLTSGLQSIGYHDRLVLPVEITPADPAQPVVLRATVDLGVCEDICIPAQVIVGTDLMAPGAMDGSIAAALADRPRVATGGATCDVAPTPGGLSVTANVTLPALRGPEVVVIEARAPGLWISDTDSARHGDRLVAVADVITAADIPVALDRSRMVVTVIGAGEAVEIAGCPAP
jgi:DsbC/DsbD-like thiol-disulfide interchange protein